MKFIDLFAGIGGFRKGLESAGHTCVGFCEIDKYAQASYRSMHLLTERERENLRHMSMKRRREEILKEEYTHGEWCEWDIQSVISGRLPRADIWTFGSPCQDFSKAGLRAGLKGDRSSLIRRVFDLLRQTDPEHRPRWIIYENVRGMLSANGGRDFLSILMALDGCGYDIEWQNLNSRYFGVPQNRERIYTVGHLRASGGSRQRVFPISGADVPTGVPIIRMAHANGFRRYNQTYDPTGSVEALDTGSGGGHNPYIGIEIAARLDPTRHSQMDVHSPDGIASTVDTLHEKKKVMITDIPEGVDTVVNPKTGKRIAIRKLTPRECFRLQGWPDEYFDRARLVNSDTQLYKQAGNGVTVTVVEAIGRRLAECTEPDQ